MTERKNRGRRSLRPYITWMWLLFQPICLWIRKDFNDVIHLTAKAKYKAIVDEITQRYTVWSAGACKGTVSIEKSELLSDMLKRRGVPHEAFECQVS